MVQRRRKRSRRWVYPLVFVLLVAIAAVICYFVWDGYFREKDDTLKEETSGVVAEKTEKKDEKVTEEKKEEEKPAPKEVVQYEGKDPNTAEGITGVITYAGVNGGKLMIRVNIDQYLAGGSCNLALRRDGGAIYGDTVEIVDSASTATCAGFDIPVEGLGNGHTNIVIFVNSGDKTGEIHGEVEL